MTDAIDICILFDTIDSPWGGGNQFLRSLSSELSAMGHRVSNRPEPTTQAVLLNAHNMGANKFLRPKQIAQLKQTGKMTFLGRWLPERLYSSGARRGPVLIHRVDGVAELVRGRRTVADDIQPAVNLLTDYTIFQTEYCRTSFAEHCRISPVNWNVINNAVDPTVFFPDPDVVWDGGTLRLIAVSWSSNQRKGFATLAEVSRLPGVELTFAGNWCPDINPANVKIAGVLNSPELAALMRSNHAMIHAAWNEPCSNAIVEAMACGLPIIYRDSGGSCELAGEYGTPLSGTRIETLNTFKSLYAILRRKLLRDRDRFLISRAANEYVSSFRHAIAHYTP